MTADARLLEAVADNHRAWFRGCSAAAGARVVELAGGELCLAREAMIFPRGDSSPTS